MSRLGEIARSTVKNWVDGHLTWLAIGAVLIELGLYLWFPPFAVIGLGVGFVLIYLNLSE